MSEKLNKLLIKVYNLYKDSDNPQSPYLKLEIFWNLKALTSMMRRGLNEKFKRK